MNNTLKIMIATACLSGAIATTGCSDDDAAAGPVVPANAIAIDDTNAAPLLQSTTLAVTALIGAEASASPADAMAIVAETVADARNNRGTSGGDSVSGVAWGPEVFQCFVSGSVTEQGDETAAADFSSGSGTGSVTFDMCDEGFGVVLDGVLNFSYSWNGDTWNDNANGSLSMIFGTESVSINNINFAENGNDATGDYTTTSFSFTFDPSAGGGFSAQVTTPITGNEFQGCPTSPDGGVILITGANSTQAQATINGDGTVTVAAGTAGALTPVAGNPYQCSDFFF